jgi:hypothetical protein
MAEYLIYQNDSTGSVVVRADRVAVVKRIVHAVDDEGVPVRKVYVTQNGNNLELTAEESNCVFDRALSDIKEKDVNTYAVSEGDVIRFAVNAATGHVGIVYIVYDADAPNPSGGAPGWLKNATEKYFVRNNLVQREEQTTTIYGTTDASSALTNGNPYVGIGGALTGPAHYPLIYNVSQYLGWAVSRDVMGFKATTQNLSQTAYIPSGIPANEELDATESFTGIYLPVVFNPVSGRIDVVELKKTGVTVRAGSLSDIRTYEEVGHDCSKVLVVTSEGDIQSVIVFEDYR